MSIEEGLLERGSRFSVGDEMRFDVLGRIITARVASVRRVDWQDFRAGGFMFVFRPGTFDGAPHTYIAARARRRATPDARARMQARARRAVSERLGHRSARDPATRSSGIVNNVTLAVTVVGGLVLFSGALILIGAVSMTKFRRVYEAAILKTLGASSRLIATMLLLEYGVLGAIAGTVGALGAIALSWAVARYALELPWEPTPVLTIDRHRRHRGLRRRRRRACQPRRAAPQAAGDAARRVGAGATCYELRDVHSRDGVPDAPVKRGQRSTKPWTWRSTGTRCCGSAASCWAALPPSRCSGRWRTTPAARATWPTRPAATTKSTSS